MSTLDEVRSLIGYAQGSHGGDAETRAVLLAGAQAEATLLLAEEQRTANLIALAASGRSEIHPHELIALAAERMGLAP